MRLAVPPAPSFRHHLKIDSPAQLSSAVQVARDELQGVQAHFLRGESWDAARP